MPLFDTLQNRTVLSGVLEMDSGLTVGSRLSLEPVGTDLPVMKRPDGTPFIPGSSLKGVIRSQAERLFRTIAYDQPQPVVTACDPLSKTEVCVPHTRQQTLWIQSQRNDATYTDLVWAESCSACRMFGSQWFAGRIAFKDAFLLNAEDFTILTQIRDGVGIDRDLGAAAPNIKYDFETVVPGTQFGIEIVTENLDMWEVGALLSVLRLWQDGVIAIGGKSTRGTGWGRLQNLSLRRITKESFLAYLTGGKMPEVEATPFYQALERKVI